MANKPCDNGFSDPLDQVIVWLRGLLLLTA
jgi:hypothetical protein